VNQVPPGAPAGAASAPHADARVAELEARCTQLQKDVRDIALFARALLLSLEQKGVASEAEFQAALAKLRADAPV
jgi:hypothetical protein